ncbi:uncharacterized protein SRS1_14259 [Sporisorium reilianum f. sp. reilianum]|uniref:Uncharacterized protein n=1 Tax=Sporisorium reilianum f. sp. reilianum TaxID=72559 RepID=A0A2N8UGG7_9BASI|nr:uncharacterized protein SRS1_14259 [Sporisorium reilianum f. sp. reilianum]
MAKSEGDRKCRNCQRTLPIGHFRSPKAPDKVRKKCRSCRTNKPYSRSVETAAAAKGTKPTPTTTVVANDHQLSKQGGPSRKQSSDKDRVHRDANVAGPSKSGPSNATSNTSKPSTASAASRTISAIVSGPKIYQHRAPPGLAFSGPMDKTKNIQRQRRFLVPPGVVRDKHSDFPSLKADLEKGMIAHTPGCLECSVKKIHCTYGAGVRLNGKSRDPTTGKCDYCIFTTRKCRGNGYEGNRKGEVGAHTELVEVLDRLDAQVDTCLRAGEQDRSARVCGKRLIKRIAEVRGKLERLSSSLAPPETGVRGERGGGSLDALLL